MKNGTKIQNISAIRLYECVIGDRKNFKKQDGILPSSILTDYLVEKKIIEKNAEFTKELVMVNFDYDYLDDSKIDEEFTVRHKGDEATKEEIRTYLYENGFDLTYSKNLYYSADTGELLKRKKKDCIEKIKKITIHYEPLYRTSNKAKHGGEVFINSKYAYDVDNYMCMGMKEKIESHDTVKLVEILAYKSLIASGCIGNVRIKPSEILILDDVESSKEQYIESVETDINKIVHVISNNGIVKNTLFDGQALLDDSLFANEESGMMVLRNHLFKACGFRSNIQLFMKDYCKENNKNYETARTKDKFGHQRYLKNIKMITTVNAIKWLKFKYLFKDEKEICDYWFDFIKQTNYQFGIVKTDHPSKYGDYQRMSYQMSNDLPLTYEQTKQVFKYSMEYIAQIKNDDDVFKQYLKDKADEVNGYEMIYDLIDKYPSMIYSDFVNKTRTDIAYDLTQELLKGKPKVKGDNLTVCGNPYALLKHSVGELDTENPVDECFTEQDNCIEVYTTRFGNDEYLAGFRSPNNSPNNVCYYQNKRSAIMERYFKFSPNIMAVNGVKTDVQDRNCGEDYDADFNLVTNDEIIVECAKECVENFPTMVNNIPPNNVEYKYSIKNVADIDNKIAKSGLAIGESSNLAQLALSYYWDEKVHWIPDKNKMEDMKNIFVEMSVIAQIAIDSAKRTYDVDYEKENKDKRFTSEYPRFFRYIKEKLKESNVVYNIECPMEYVQDIVKIDEKDHHSRFDTMEYIKCIDIAESNYKQINKMIELVNEWTRETKTEKQRKDGTTYFEYTNEKKMNEIIQSIKSMKVKDATMNRVLSHIFGDNVKGETTKLASKNRKKLMMCLYKAHKEIFLNQFVDIDVSQKDKKIDKNSNIKVA